MWVEVDSMENELIIKEVDSMEKELIINVVNDFSRNTSFPHSLLGNK